MEAKNDPIRHHAEGIIAELANYLEIRYQYLTRIRPSLASMYGDLLWIQMEKVRIIMMEEKMFGAVRPRVAEILASRDESKKRCVLAPVDQASIMPELVPDEESFERRPGNVIVRSVRALYMMVDASLAPVIELSDIWLWWDVHDAVCVHNFREQKALLDRLQPEPMTKEKQDLYYQAMGRRDDRTVTLEEMLSFEFAHLESIWRIFQQRRLEEKSFMMVIKRDAKGDRGLDDLIVTLGRHITTRRRLTDEGGLDDRLREYYARVLKVEPARVAAEEAVGHEEAAIRRLREDLKEALGQDEVLGEPYNYKRAQSDEMRRDLEQYRKTLPLVDAIVQASLAPVRASAPAPGLSRPEPAPAARRAVVVQDPLEGEQPFLFGGSQ